MPAIFLQHALSRSPLCSRSLRSSPTPLSISRCRFSRSHLPSSRSLGLSFTVSLPLPFCHSHFLSRSRLLPPTRATDSLPSLSRALRPFSLSVVLSVSLFLSLSPSPPPPPFSFPRSLALPDERERRDGERIGVSVVTPHARVMPSLLVRPRARRPSPAIALPSRSSLRGRRSLASSEHSARTALFLPSPRVPPLAHAPHYTRFCVQAAPYTVVESFCRVG